MQYKHIFKSFFFSIIAFCMVLNASAHWTSKGPFGGRARCFLASDTLLYVGSVDGGVYRSTTSAVNAWRYANYTGLTNGNINALVQHGTNILAGTNTGVFRSTDIGATWSTINTGLTNTNVDAMVTVGTRVLAGTNGGGIFKSDDGGNTWTASNTGLTHMIISCFAYDGTRVFAGTMGGGVFVSTNNGDTWTVVNSGLTDLFIETLVTSGGNVFAGCISSGIHFSSASSVSWTTSNTGLTSTLIYSLVASGGNVYAGTAHGVFKTADASPSWSAVNTGFNQDAVALGIFNGKIYLGTDDDGIYKSNSLTSISWVRHNNGFNNLESYAVYNDGLLVITATSKGLFVSRDLAASYVSANTGLTDSLTITNIRFGGSDLFVGTFGGGVYRSSDTGATWTQVNTGLVSTLNVRQMITTNTHIFIGMDNGTIWSSPLSAIVWTAPTSAPAVPVITAFATNGTQVWVAGYGDGVFTTTDNTNWTAFNTGLSSMNITSLATLGGSVYVGSDAGVFKSGTSSASWSAVNTGLPTLDIQSLYATGAWVVAGYRGGVHATYDAGASWEPTSVMDYIPEYTDIREISFTTASTRIFITTTGNSIYSNGVSELPVGIRELSPVASSFHISPNPNNGQFTITLKDGNNRIENISVIDLHGKTIHHFAATKAASDISVSMILPKGIYLLKVASSNGTLAEKLVIE